MTTGIRHSLDHGTARPVAIGISHCLDHSRAGLWPPWPGGSLAQEAQERCTQEFRLQRPPQSPRRTLRRKGARRWCLWCQILEGLVAFAAVAEERAELRGDPALATSPLMRINCPEDMWLCHTCPRIHLNKEGKRTQTTGFIGKIQ